jgi:spermidine synthase
MQSHSYVAVLTAAFLLGCFATLAQVILFREQLIILEGNELALSLLLFWWLIGISFGALLPKRFGAEKRLPLLFPSVLIATPLLLAASVVVTRMSPWFLALPVEEKPSPFSMFLISMESVLPIGVGIGFAFPVMALAYKRARCERNMDSHIDAISIGAIFGWESFGSVFGGLLIMLKMTPRYDPFSIVFFMLTGVFLLLLFERKRRQSPGRIWGILLLAMAMAILFQIPNRLDAWSASIRWDARHDGYRAVRSLETPYQRLEIGERDGQFTVFGSGAFLFSYPNAYESSHWAHVALSQLPNPDSVLLIGSGGRDLIEHILEHRPQRFVCVEIDAGIQTIMMEAEESRMQPIDGVEWVYSDPRRYLSELKDGEKFDVIAINQPDPSNGLLNRFYTREFFTLANERLRPGGVFVITATGTPNYQFGDIGVFCGTLYWTLRDVFPNVMAVPGVQWWFFAGPSHRFCADPDVLANRMREQDVQCDRFAPELYSLYFDELRIEQLQPVLDSYQELPRNTDLRPLCYLYDLIIHSKQYGFFKHLSIERFSASGLSLLLLSCVIILFLYGLLAFGIRISLPKNMVSGFSPLLLLAAAGLASIGAEIAILLFFQSRVGYLYQHVGIFLAFFMLGLALGAAAGNHLLRTRKNSCHALLLRTDSGLITLLAISPLILAATDFFSLSVIQTEILLLGWIGFIAFAAGVLFPLVSRAVEESVDDLTAVAGKVDMSDCFGGAVGALLLGAFLIPIVGLAAVFYIFVGIKILALLPYCRLRRYGS